MTTLYRNPTVAETWQGHEQSPIADAGAIDDARMRHFRSLDQARQVEAIQRLALDGWSARGIAHATGLSVEQVQRVLAEVSAP